MAAQDLPEPGPPDLRRGDETDELGELDELFSALDEERQEQVRAERSASSFLATDRDWASEFGSAREIMVRPAFESILWRLEERGFDADVVTLPSGGEGDGPPRGDDDQALDGIALTFAGTSADGSSVRGAATVEAVPALGLVRVRSFLDEPAHELLDTQIPLESLTEEYVLGTTADLLARAFFGEAGPPRRVAEDDGYDHEVAWPDGEDDGAGEPADAFDPEEALERPGALRRSTTAKLSYFEFDQDQWERDLEELTDELPDPDR